MRELYKSRRYASLAIKRTFIIDNNLEVSATMQSFADAVARQRSDINVELSICSSAKWVE